MYMRDLKDWSTRELRVQSRRMKVKNDYITIRYLTIWPLYDDDYITEDFHPGDGGPAPPSGEAGQGIRPAKPLQQVTQ